MKKIIKKAINDLRAGRGAHLAIRTSRGEVRRLVLIPSTLYNDVNGSLMPRLELLIAFEKSGAIFYDGRQPLNKFKLVGKGFPIEVAEMVTDLIEQLFAHANKRLTVPASQAKGIEIWIPQ